MNPFRAFANRAHDEIDALMGIQLTPATYGRTDAWGAPRETMQVNGQLRIGHLEDFLDKLERLDVRAPMLVSRGDSPTGEYWVKAHMFSTTTFYSAYDAFITTADVRNFLTASFGTGSTRTTPVYVYEGRLGPEVLFPKFVARVR